MVITRMKRTGKIRRVWEFLCANAPDVTTYYIYDYKGCYFAEHPRDSLQLGGREKRVEAEGWDKRECIYLYADLTGGAYEHLYMNFHDRDRAEVAWQIIKEI